MRGYYNNGLFIEKYQYINNDGIKRTAIIKSRELYTNSFFKKMNILTKIDFVVFGIAYIILVVIFVFVLRSKFYEPLEKLLEQGKATLPACETALDMLYFKTIWKIKDKYLSKAEAKMLAQCFGTKMDMLNIQWICRSK